MGTHLNETNNETQSDGYKTEIDSNSLEIHGKQTETNGDIIVSLYRRKGFSIAIPSITCPSSRFSVRILSAFAEYAATTIRESRKESLYFSSISDARITDMMLLSLIFQLE